LTLEQSAVDAASDAEAEFQSWESGTPRERSRWSQHWLSTPGAAPALTAFDLASAAVESQSSLGRANQLLNAARQELLDTQAELRRLSDQYQDEVNRFGREEQQLRQVCATQRTALERIERHPILGPALRGRRRLRKVLRAVNPVLRARARIT
jgi:hypothetical protein